MDEKISEMVRQWAVVAASAIVTHLSAIGAGFVWLDHAHLEDKLAIAPPSQWLTLFTTGFAGTGYYRPLMALSLSLDALLGTPVVFHAVSIAWHALAAVLVCVAAESLRLSRRAATLAGIFFAVHPISALIADAIAFRSEAMLAAALLLLVWAHTHRRPVAAALAIFLGALTKEPAFILGPLFILTLEWPRFARVPADAAGRRGVFVAEAVGWGAAFALRMAFAPAWRASHPEMGVGDAIGTRLAALAKSAAVVILPIDRTVCDAFTVTHLWEPAALAGGLALAGLAWGAWRRGGAALLLALAVLPSLELVPVSRWWSPHYVYLPLAFFSMLLAETVEPYAERARLAVFGVLVVLGAVTLVEGRRYASDAALWTAEVAKQPACREGQFYLGEVARLGKHWDAAARRYEAALMPRPGILAFVDRQAALQNLGVVRLEQHRFADARKAFTAALEGTTNEHARRELTHDLAVASLNDGDPAEASRLLAPETSRPDAFPQSIELRALALDRLGRHDEARALRTRR